MHSRYLVFSLVFHISVLSVVVGDIGYFWHLTDFHYDPHYSLKGDVNYRCRMMSKSSDSMHSHIFGEYVCDTPLQLINSLVHFMILQKQEADFVIWTGNGSVDRKHTLSELIQAVGDIYHVLSHLKDVKMYPALGWIDFMVIWNSTNKISKQKFHSTIAHLFKDSLTHESVTQFSKTGCYSEVYDTLRLLLVIFNTNLLLKGNDASLSDDPEGIWSWLRKELLKAREKDLKVYLIMSVPPGVFESGLSIPGDHWFRQKHNRKYIVMVREFHDVIKAQFAGHHHTDTFRILYNKNEFPVSWLLVAPSVAPNYLHTGTEVAVFSNPAARIYKYDKGTLEVLDYTQFSLNLSECNINEIKCWKKAYSFKKHYNVPNISSLSLKQITDNFQRDGKNFRLYFNAVYSAMYSESNYCDDWCAYYHICAIHNVDYSSFLECVAGWYPVKPVPGLRHHIWETEDGNSSGPRLSLLLCFVTNAVANLWIILT